MDHNLPNFKSRTSLSLNLGGVLEGLEALVQLHGGFALVFTLDGPAFLQGFLGLLFADEGAQLLQDNGLLQLTVLQGSDLLEEAVGKALDVLGGVLEVLGLDLGLLLLGQFQFGGALFTMLLGQGLLILGQFDGLKSKIYKENVSYIMILRSKGHLY